MFQNNSTDISSSWGYLFAKVLVEDSYLLVSFEPSLMRRSSSFEMVRESSNLVSECDVLEAITIHQQSLVK